MITGTVVIDLSVDPFAVVGKWNEARADWNRDRRQLATLERCPDGCHVVVEIGTREFPSVDAAAYLRAHAERLEIEIRGSRPEGVRAFVMVGRSCEEAA